MQRVDRNLEEMTGELRVVVTGVQVLFAFLLIVPFNRGFVGVGPFERGVYFATLLCSVFAALCTLAPAAYHRLLFRADDKPHLLFVANGFSIAGLAFLALAMCGSLLLVTTKLFGAKAGVVTAALVAVPFAGLWFVAPLLRRAKREPAADATGLASAGHVSGMAAAPPRTVSEQPDPGQWGKALRYDAGVGAQEHLRVDARRSEDRVVLHLTGELDLASSPIFERALEDADVASAPLLVLDLDELEVRRLDGAARDPAGPRGLARARPGVRDHAGLAAGPAAAQHHERGRAHARAGLARRPARLSAPRRCPRRQSHGLGPVEPADTANTLS